MKVLPSKFGKQENDVNPTVGYKIWGGFWQNGSVMKIEDRRWRMEDGKDGVDVRPRRSASDQSQPRGDAETLRLVGGPTQPRSGDGDTLKGGHRAGRRFFPELNLGSRREVHAFLPGFAEGGKRVYRFCTAFVPLVPHPGDFFYFSALVRVMKSPKIGYRVRGLVGVGGAGVSARLDRIMCVIFSAFYSYLRLFTAFYASGGTFYFFSSPRSYEGAENWIQRSSVGRPRGSGRICAMLLSKLMLWRATA